MKRGYNGQGSREQVVAFRLGDEFFAIDILHIQEVLHLQRVTAIPNAPSFVRGVIDVRGQVIPVIDLKRRLGLPSPEATRGRIIILDCGGRLLGLPVDAVHKVLQLTPECLEELPEAVVRDRKGSCLARLVKTETEGIIVVIAPDRILTHEESEQWRTFHSGQTDAG